MINDVIKSITYLTLAAIIGVIVSAYVFYFVGVAVSLAAGAILGASGAIIAEVFAWLGVAYVFVIALLCAAKIIGGLGGEEYTELTDEELALLEKMLEVNSDKGDDN